MESHFLFLCILVISIGATDCGMNLTSSRTVSLEPLDASDTYVRICTHKEITNIKSAYVDNGIGGHETCSSDENTFNLESTFKMKEPGLTGEPGTVSFESFQFPDHYLVHGSHKVWVKRSFWDEPKKRFKRHATFNKVKGHATCDPAVECFSFESVVIRNKFLQHCTHWPTGDLVMGNNKGPCKTDGGTFAKQVTFQVQPPLAKGAEVVK